MSKSNIPNNITPTPPKTTRVLPHVTKNLHEVYTLGKKLGEVNLKGHYSERQTVKLIGTIVEDVDACHSLGVMHRDFKHEIFFYCVDKDVVLS
ncbi:calcium-dependent kinase family protein [Medicago truncatula]|uniref:Calcium-dependent kinase family protein n=1 Tax=Medicago truncatula TaxID=3880 RepID=A0A072VJU6_MEDTR|nr:calcium-dependent kinase family protein [Medicago truncatula]